MPKNRLAATSPVLKWAGGKRQLLHALTPLLPKRMTAYCEPFVGGGALWFYLQPKTAYVNDINKELILVYTVVRDDVEALIRALEGFKNESDAFYAVRGWDRDKERYAALPDAQRAARTVYLNKTCYNGLFRVNSAGEFNSPFGNYKNPNIVNALALRAVSAYLRASAVHFSAGDYADVLRALPKGAFAYLDPPYDPVSDTASFTGYAMGGFGRQDQIALRDRCAELTGRGVKFMLSNSNTGFIQSLYGNHPKWNMTVVNAKRPVNSVAAKRGDVEEVVVRNYE